MDFELTRTVLGQPTAVKKARPGSEAQFTVARWKCDGANFIDVVPNDVLLINVCLSDGQHVERRMRGRWTHAPCAVGSVSISDPQENTAYRIRGESDVLLLFLPVALLDVDAAGASIRVPAKFQARHAEIERCAMRALIALREGDAADELLFSSIAQRLSGCLVEKAGSDLEPKRGGLGVRPMRRATALIEACLADPGAKFPTLDEIAGEAGISKFHFVRAFRETIGETPHAYVLRRRLDLARTALTRGRVSVAEVARLAGFASPAHFVSRFHRAMGITPGAFRDIVRA